MIPNDYKHLSPDVLARIKPLTDEPETADPDQLAARRYLADQGISLKTAVSAHLGCPRTAASVERTARTKRTLPGRCTTALLM